MKCSVIPAGRLRANCCLIGDDAGNAVLVDPGGDGDLLLSCIADRQLTVKAILLTHGHGDHTGALAKLRSETGAPVYAHGADDDFFRLEADVRLRDGDTVEAGEMRFSVIHVPGHTPGSVLYVTEDLMLSGDTLFRESIGRTDLPGGDSARMRESLRKILDLPCGDLHVIPGHGPMTTLDYEREFNPYFV